VARLDFEARRADARRIVKAGKQKKRRTADDVMRRLDADPQPLDLGALELVSLYARLSRGRPVGGMSMLPISSTDMAFWLDRLGLPLDVANRSIHVLELVDDEIVRRDAAQRSKPPRPAERPEPKRRR